MRNRGLKLFMAVLMIIAIYITFRYKILPSTTEPSKYKIVVVDPGHGGTDPGKVGINEALEKDVNLKIAYILKDELEAAGFKVILTRTQDSGLYQEKDSNKKLADMKARCKIIEESKADIVVSIHQNSFAKESVHGAQMFYYRHSAEGKRLAECLQSAFSKYVDEENHRVAKDNDNYYMLLHTPCPTVIAECGFLSNAAEAELLCSEDYQKKIASGICQGIKEYFQKDNESLWKQ